MQPNRRTFLRQVGGGLAATSALLSACRAHHARAIEAAVPEAGPGPSFAGLDRLFEALTAVLA